MVLCRMETVSLRYGAMLPEQRSMKEERRETRESLSSSEDSVTSCVPRRATSTGIMNGRNTTMSCTNEAKLWGKEMGMNTDE